MTLRRIRIQGLGVIDEAELDLSEGLNVITGETGAGKTMVVSGLGLLLGARADAGLVRAGAEQSVVEGEVDVPVEHPAALRVAEAGGDASDGVLLVRTVAAGGRSRAYVGGRTAPVAVLAEVGQHLVAVHGQADQWRLRDAEQHRILLDSAGGADLAQALRAYEDAYDQWQASRAGLVVEIERGAAERSLRVDALRAALTEIDELDPREGEEDDLRAESERLTHAEELLTASRAAHDALVGADDPGTEVQSVAQLVSAASVLLGPAAAHDPELAALRRRVDEIGYLASDLASDLSGYASGVDVDGERLDAVHRRRADLTALLRRYGPSTQALLTFARGARDEARLDLSDDDVAELRRRTEALRLEVGRLGGELSSARARVGERVGRAVTEELSHLAMGAAEVVVHVAPRKVSAEGAAGRVGGDGPADRALRAGRAEGADGAEGAERADGAGTGPASCVPLPDGRLASPRRHGLDEVEIRLAANPGAPPRSVARAASGGELSRVMLALEVVCGDGSVPTYVFDEVDAGVGGSAALDLGARLARLARTAQVVVVTHLGQVAAYADRHLVVRKSSDGQVTSSDVVVVEGAEREAELARMLGGIADSRAAVEHARELLARRGEQASA
ncbi:DNA repair protein RecN [Ornithinimicrobium sp. W1665]|uniref:DNA repair protein RecN n=1 Tax=Ornithinimicrobium sp. W1665 TaxID=3416666 RepID=UPI003D6B2B74